MSEEELYNEDLIQCDICGEYFEEEYMCEDLFITEGGRIHVCEECVNNGYGE